MLKRVWRSIIDYLSELRARRELRRITPSNAELLELVKKHSPPKEWYEEDFDGLF
jgi:hypothetical protein